MYSTLANAVSRLQLLRQPNKYHSVSQCWDVVPGSIVKRFLHSHVPPTRTKATTNSIRSLNNFSAIGRSGNISKKAATMCQRNNSTESSSQAVPSGRQVLPENVRPLHYDLTLEPSFKTFKFDGEETIDFHVVERSDYIELNSVDIEVKEAHLNDVAVKEISYDKEKQRVKFHLSDHLKAGAEAQLKLKFVGDLNDIMAGFYRSTYQQDGETKYLATTQMEPTDCSRAFPCYDEPSAKAKFTISLIADKDLVALSNMPEKETTLLSSGKKKVTFHTTPLMSSYLVAFVVGDLKYVENTSYRVPIKVYATPGNEHLGKYAADITAKTLKFFDDAFKIPYPLPKCDLIAIHDFSAGAMENFGLITFRSVDLLLDPDHTNVNTKKRVTEVVMHELAHQWFGNLVTMDYWDGLWLNEGFATWMSWYACDALNPDWKVWESYVSDTLQNALSLDALRSSHPVEVPVKKAAEINQIFDAISYSKGSSLLTMLSKWLGEDVFISGVSAYLKKHKWGNAKTSDLWESLSSVSGKDVLKVMEIWTKKIGFPLLEVKENGNKLELTQHRFLSTGDVKDEDDETLYPIFLRYKTSEGVHQDAIMTERTQTIELENTDFFKFNSDQTGVFRVAYEDSRWKKLGKDAVDGKLSVEDRTGLVADASALASAGFIPTTSLLDLVNTWTDESNYVVWDEILSTVSSVKRLMIFESENIRDALDSFTLDLISKKLDTLGWEFGENDSYADQQLKSSLFSYAASSGHKKVVEFSKAAFAKFVSGDKNAINPNIRGSIFSVVAKYGDEKTYDDFLNIYKNPSSIEEKYAALSSLGRFTKPELLEKTTSLLLKTDFIKPQDIHYPLVGLRSHSLGIKKLWEWLTTNWDKIYIILPPTSTTLGLVVKVSTIGFTKPEQKKAVLDFFDNKDTEGYDKSLAQALDLITSKISWSTRDAKSLSEWLETNNYIK